LIGHEMCRSREDFIIHFKETYSDPYPPAWIISEILPFGIITNIYNNIRDKKIKKRISQSTKKVMYLIFHRKNSI